MKKIGWTIITIILLTLEIAVISYEYTKDIDNTIPKKYIAVFKGETAEVVYTTYLYQKKNGKKVTYKYKNTTTQLTGYDSTELTEKITKNGKLKKHKDIFKIAKKNTATTYGKYEKDDAIYTIEEMKKFIK